ncbi:hypothetical protein [Methanogenium cariaci]
MLENIFIDRMEHNVEMKTRFMNENDFQNTLGGHLLEKVYDQIHAEEGKSCLTQEPVNVLVKQTDRHAMQKQCCRLLPLQCGHRSQ